MRTVVLSFRCLVVLAVLLGVLCTSQARWDAPQLSVADLGTELVYFTTQSNLLLAAVTAWSVVAELAHRRGPSPWASGGAVLFTTITGLVYNTVLVPGGGAGAVLLLSGHPASDLLHVVVPVAALVDRLVLHPDAGSRVRRNLGWLVYPLAYLAFVLVRGWLVGSGVLASPVRYPYFFIDVAAEGGAAVARNSLLMLVAFALLTVVFTGLDRLAAALRGRRTGRAAPGVGTSRPAGG